MPSIQSSEESARQLVYLAAERTLLTWIRTALGLMALGFVIDRFGIVLRQTLPQSGPQILPQAFSFWVGTLFVLLGVAMLAAGALRFYRFARSYHQGNPTQSGRGIYISIGFTLALIIIGLGTVFFLVLVTE